VAVVSVAPRLTARTSNSRREPIVITVVDNYDSFTYNLVQQIERLAGERLRVIRNDAFEPRALLAERPRAIVISPGPGTPARAGRCLDLIRANEEIPLLEILHHLERRAVPFAGRALEQLLCERGHHAARRAQHLYPIDPGWQRRQRSRELCGIDAAGNPRLRPPIAH